MAENQDIGMYARHPVRTAGIAVLLGSAFGAGMMAAKQQREKSWIQKMLEGWKN